MAFHLTDASHLKVFVRLKSPEAFSNEGLGF
jgi:hypothetical protein